ncbi:MAG: thiamine phosphate synthase [Acidobacteriota bacterium]
MPDPCIRCYITDRRGLPPGIALIDYIGRNLASGIDWIQIRDKDLSARDLFDLTQQVLKLPNPHGSKILVNTRVDVALAAGAAGVHLPAGSPAPRVWRALTPPGFQIGVSCHTVDEVRGAEDEGADYAVFGPVFAPLSKAADLEPRGIEGLAQAVRAVHIPVLALGGITAANAQDCIQAGAAGVAAISLYQSCRQSC